MQSCQSGDWIIHKCANCGIDTHITHSVKGDNKVFVTDKIEVGENVTVQVPTEMMYKLLYECC